jgi:hypothetical protein
MAPVVSDIAWFIADAAVSGAIIMSVGRDAGLAL